MELWHYITISACKRSRRNFCFFRFGAGGSGGLRPPAGFSATSWRAGDSGGSAPPTFSPPCGRGQTDLTYSLFGAVPRPGRFSATSWRGRDSGGSAPPDLRSLFARAKSDQKHAQGVPPGNLLISGGCAIQELIVLPNYRFLRVSNLQNHLEELRLSPFQREPGPVFCANRWLYPFNRPTGEVGIDGCIDQKPVGICCSEALQILHFCRSSTKAVDRPEGGRRRFGYFAAEGKVTRAGARNSPKQTESQMNLPRHGVAETPRGRRPKEAGGRRPPNPHYSLLRMIFPLMVLGSSSRNTTIRGYL